MSYKLNKNLTTPFLALLMILSHASTGQAQGVVSLVDDNAGFEDDPFPNESFEAEPQSASEVAPNMQMDTQLPTTLSEEDVIPLDGGLISPTEPETKPIVDATEKSTVADPKSEEEDNTLPTDTESNKPFSLELPQNKEVLSENSDESQPTSDNPLGNENSESAPSPLFVNSESENTSAPLLPNSADINGPTSKTGEKFANTVLSRIDNDLFGQMSDIEKQTTLLTLELRREKIRSEIEAVKAQREKAEQEKIMAEEEKKRQEFEWQKEQEAKVLREQQALKEKEIELEKLKQRKMLNAYMNQMLVQNQKWIDENAQLHKKMRKIEEDRRHLAEDFKGKLNELTAQSSKLIQSAETAKGNHERIVANLTAQNVQLKKRIEADALAAKNREQNPFGDNVNPNGVQTSVDGQMQMLPLSKDYAIMEITGKGDQLAARLINKDGETFIVKTGAMLNTGHMVDEITDRYVQFDKNGLKDYLYTAGSATGMEPQKMDGTATTQTTQPAPAVVQQRPVSMKGVDQGVPSLGTGMFVK